MPSKPVITPHFADSTHPNIERSLDPKKQKCVVPSLLLGSITKRCDAVQVINDSETCHACQICSIRGWRWTISFAMHESMTEFELHWVASCCSSWNSSWERVEKRWERERDRRERMRERVNANKEVDFCSLISVRKVFRISWKSHPPYITLLLISVNQTR